MSIQIKNAIKILKKTIKEKRYIKDVSVMLGFDWDYFRKVKGKFNTDSFKNSPLYNVLMELHDEYLAMDYEGKFKSSNSEESYSESKKTNRKSKDTTVEDKYDERSSCSENRGEDNKILSYNYRIFIRDEKPLEGILTRNELEEIYKLYPYITSNNVSQFFPYITFQNFKRILRTFNITKQNLFPKHILEEHTLDEIAEFALKAKEHSAYKKFVENKKNFLEKSLRDTQSRLFDITSDNELYDDMIKKYYQENNSNRVVRKNNNIKNSNEVTYCLFSDIHYGKKYNTPIFGRGYNKEIAHERVMQIAENTINYVKANKSDKLVMCFMGDLLESIEFDGMRPGHTLTMDIIGEEQLFYAVDSLKEMLSSIIDKLPNVNIELYVTHGNHDRIGEKRDYDKKRTGGVIAFKMLKRELGDSIKIHFNDQNLVKIENKDNICIIGHHGDSSIVKRKPHELVNLYGNGTKSYHLIVSGHFHSTKIESGTNYLSMSLPSVCSTDEFVKDELGYNDLPAFILGKKSPYDVNRFDYNFITLY